MLTKRLLAAAAISVAVVAAVAFVIWRQSVEIRFCRLRK